MPYRREAPKPPVNEQKDRPTKERKHWLDYSIFFFVILTAGATWAAYYTQQQFNVASDEERRQLRAYVGPTPGDISNLGDATEQTFTATRKNYDATPAYDVSVAVFGQSVIQRG